MADVATAIRKHLMSKSSITDVISTRMYPSALPTDPTYPSVTYAIAAHDHEGHLGGASGIAHAVIQFDAYNEDPLDSRKDAGICEVMRDELLDPDIAHTTVQGVWIEGITLLSGPIELYSPPRDGSQKGRFRSIVNYRVSYAEAVPT